MFGIRIIVERWKLNKEFDVYVSTEGRVKDRKRKLIEPKINNAGYFYVRLGAYKKTLHALVIETWKGKSEMTIDHINGNRRDCSLRNLEYVTREENIKRAQDMKEVDEAERLITSLTMKGLTMKLIKDTLEAMNSGESAEDIIIAPSAGEWFDAFASKFPSRLNGLTKSVAVGRILSKASQGKSYLGYDLKRKPDGTIVGHSIGR